MFNIRKLLVEHILNCSTRGEVFRDIDSRSTLGAEFYCKIFKIEFPTHLAADPNNPIRTTMAYDARKAELQALSLTDG